MVTAATAAKAMAATATAATATAAMATAARTRVEISDKPGQDDEDVPKIEHPGVPEEIYNFKTLVDEDGKLKLQRMANSPKGTKTTTIS